MIQILLRLRYYIFYTVYGLVKYLPTPLGDIGRFLILRLFFAKIRTHIIHEGVTFRDVWRVEIGKHSEVMEYVYFSGHGKITIGDNVLIGRNTAFYSLEHAFDNLDTLISKQPVVPKPIIVHDNIYIGTNVVVLGGSIINAGAVIGAASVVKGVIPKNAIVAGVPAKLIRYRTNQNKKVSAVPTVAPTDNDI